MVLSNSQYLIVFALVVSPIRAHDLVQVQIEIDDGDVLNTIDNHFLSVALDSDLIQRRWKHLDLRSPMFRTLSRGLSPSYLRVGGTAADFLIFDPNGDPSTLSVRQAALPIDGYGLSEWYETHKNYSNFTMTGGQWLELNEFARDVDFQVIFDLNVLLRDSQNRWDFTNAEGLLRFNTMYNYPVDFELGNEPDAFHHAFNRSFTAHQLGRDFLTLRHILDKYSLYQRSSLIGPDLTRLRNKKVDTYFKSFLAKAHSVLNATTFHHYYINGRTASSADFTDVSILDSLVPMLSQASRLVQQVEPGLPIWLGETSSAWGGGAQGLSDTYIAGFMWLDKLGLCAKHGIKAVIRQSLYSGHYALLNDDMTPRPDYWLSLLYKQLVGYKVFNVSMVASPTKQRNKNCKKSKPCQIEKIRLYAHSTRMPSFTKSVTLYGFNIYRSKVAHLMFPDSWYPLEIYQYLLTPGDNKTSLESSSVRLNGEVIKFNNSSSKLPDLKGKLITLMHPGSVLKLPPLTMAFFVITNHS